MTRIPCPSEAWDTYCEEGDDTRCARCGADLPDEDPGVPNPLTPGARFDSVWQDGFCSCHCFLAHGETASHALPMPIIRGLSRREVAAAPIRTFIDLCERYGTDVKVGEILPNGWRPEGGYEPDADGGTHPATQAEAEALALRRLQRVFFKYTDAGLPVDFDFASNTFTVAPYCEGSDGLDMHGGYRVTLPCHPDAIDDAEKAAEFDSRVEWNATHGCESCWNGETIFNDWGEEVGPEDYGMRPIDPKCPDCQGGGIVC